MYKRILKPLFFKFDPERIHHLTFRLVRFSVKIPGMKALFKRMYCVEDEMLEREVFGLKFPNPVGLAAGFDKNATLYNELEYFGFGFVEIGTVTPKGQPGNELKRLFRLKQDEAIINRMGFNNEGAEAAAARLRQRRTKILIGGNIGKNKVTPNEDAILDYEKCFQALFPYVDYFVVNVSSPNTPGLRDLQDKGPLTQILQRLMSLNEMQGKMKPILLKIAPDLEQGGLDDIVDIVAETKIAGVIATNTTISRAELKTPAETVEAIGAGGVSGKPLTQRSTEVIRYLKKKSKNAFPIIGVGGIHSEQDALEKLEAGADLVQVYTGFVYEGPGLVKRINQAVLQQEG